MQWLGRWDEALSALVRGQIGSSNPAILLDRSWIMIQIGRPEQALTLAQQALAMDPTEEDWPLHMMCKSNLFLGRYDEAVASCATAAAHVNFWLHQVYLCAAYAQAGDMSKAALSRAALLKQQPGYTIARYKATYAASPPAFFDLVDEHLAAGLRKAGIPEK